MGGGRPRLRGRPLGPAAAPPVCGAGALSRPRALLLAELEALVAEQERGALPVDLHELEVVVEGRPRLDGVDPPVDLDLELLPAVGDRDELHVVPADEDLVGWALVAVTVAASAGW